MAVKNMGKRLRINKKKRLIRMLENHGGRVPLGEAARELYGQNSELTRAQVTRVLACYRKLFPEEFANVRVRHGHVVRL